jgi:hypothetical protein
VNIFSSIMNALTGADTNTAIPGAMGDLLAQMGITEIGPHYRGGRPMNVALGCKKKLVKIPGAERLAYKRDGTPAMAMGKGNRPYHASENYAVPARQWKQMQNDMKRKAAGRWYSGAKVAA